MKKKNIKKGVVALMMVLILGTTVMVVSVSQLAYSLWMKQSLEWSVLKYQNAARASSASLYSMMNLFRDSNYTGTDAPIFYLTGVDQLQGYSLVSGINTITCNPPDAAAVCKSITTVFNKNPFAVSQYFKFLVYADSGEIRGGVSPDNSGNLLINFHIPLLQFGQ